MFLLSVIFGVSLSAVLTGALPMNTDSYLERINREGVANGQPEARALPKNQTVTIPLETYKAVEADVLRKQQAEQQYRQEQQQSLQRQGLNSLQSGNNQVAALPVMPVAMVQPTQTQSQADTNPPAPQSNVAYAAPVAQQNQGIDIQKFLSSGAMENLLSPKILGQSDAANQLIPKLVTPGLQQSALQAQASNHQAQQQQGYGQPMQYNQMNQPIYPDARQLTYPVQNQMTGYPSPMGAAGIPNFGQATPTLGFAPQGGINPGYQQGGMMQQQQPGYGGNMMNYQPNLNQPLYSGNMLPQQGFQG